MKPVRVACIVLLALALALSASALTWADPNHPEHPRELGFLLGFELADQSVTGQPRTIDHLGGLVGLRGAPIVGRDFLWFIDGTAAQHSPRFGNDVDVFTVRT